MKTVNDETLVGKVFEAIEFRKNGIVITTSDGDKYRMVHDGEIKTLGTPSSVMGKPIRDFQTEFVEIGDKPTYTSIHISSGGGDFLCITFCDSESPVSVELFTEN